MEDTVNKLFICSCNSVEHQLIMTYFTDDKEVYYNCISNPNQISSNGRGKLLNTYSGIAVSMETLMNLFSSRKMLIVCSK